MKPAVVEGVNYLLTFSEQDLYSVLTATLEQRGGLLQDLCNWAVPDYAYANARCLTDSRFSGYIKSFNEYKGHGFIESPEITEAFGMDMFVSSRQVKDAALLTPGTQVNFAILLNKGKPQAFDVNADEGIAFAASAEKGDSGGYASYGKAAVGPVAASWSHTSGPYGKGGANGKSSKGVGTVPASTGKLAWSTVPSPGKASWVGSKARGAKGDEPSASKGRAKGGGKVFTTESDGQSTFGLDHTPGQTASMFEMPGVTDTRFIGTVKKYFEDKAFGFLECEELKAQFGQDIFVHKNFLGSFVQGDIVSFAVIMNEKNGLKAVDLLPPDS